MLDIMPQSATIYNPVAAEMSFQAVIGQPIAWCVQRNRDWVMRYYTSPYSGRVDEVVEPEFFQFIRDHGLTWDAVSESYQ